MTKGTQGLESPACEASDPTVKEVASAFESEWGVLPESGAADLSEHKPQTVMKPGISLVGCSEGSSGDNFLLAEKQLVMMPEPSKTSEANNTDFRELDPTWPNLEEVSLGGGFDKRLVLDGATSLLAKIGSETDSECTGS